MYSYRNKTSLRGITFLLIIFSFNSAITQNIKIDLLNLRVFDITEFNIDFRDMRPDQKDLNIKMCLPAAFTSTRKGFIDGIYVLNGTIKVLDTMHRKYTGEIWGGVSINHGQIEIFDTKDGTLSKEIAQSIAVNGGDFFEQFLLVKKNPQESLIIHN